MAKQVRLNGKRNGSGKLSSFWVSISLNEARACGLVDESGNVAEIEKAITPDGQIIIRKIEK